MRRPSLRAQAALVAAVTLLATAGCAGTSPSQQPTAARPDQVTVGVIPILDVAPIYLGRQQGFFASRGIDLTMEIAQGGAAIIPAVTGGRYQFGFSNVVSLLLAQSQHVPVKVVANGVTSTGNPAKDFGAIVVKDPAITAARDLEGKKVASNTLNNIVDTAVREMVRKAGGDPGTVSFAEVPFPDMAAALQADQVQGIFVVEPFLSAALAQGWHSVGSYADVDPNLCVALYFTSTRLVEENPDLVARFAEAMNESLRYADAHPDEVVGILSSYSQITADMATKLTLPRWPADINRSAVEKLNNLLVGDGVLSAPADTAILLP